MKTKTILAGLILSATSSLHAATDTPKAELRGDSIVQTGAVTTAKGSAVAIVGMLKVSAEQISFDRDTGILKCVGETTVRTPQSTVKATDATIDTKEKNPSIQATDIRVER